eukprot:848424-Ditylum_brightwellii.AAC.1
MMPSQAQAAFAEYTCSLQFEWAYLQWVIKIKERAFEPLERIIKEDLFLLFCCQIHTRRYEGSYFLSHMRGVLGALNSCCKAVLKWAISIASTSHLVVTMTGEETYHNQTH